MLVYSKHCCKAGPPEKPAGMEGVGGGMRISSCCKHNYVVLTLSNCGGEGCSTFCLLVLTVNGLCFHGVDYEEQVTMLEH